MIAELGGAGLTGADVDRIIAIHEIKKLLAKRPSSEQSRAETEALAHMDEERTLLNTGSRRSNSSRVRFLGSVHLQEATERVLANTHDTPKSLNRQASREMGEGKDEDIWPAA